MSFKMHRDELRLAADEAADVLELRLLFRAEGVVIFSL
jgi:hypothetical protein